MRPALPRAWEWQRQGACRGFDVELFFHPDGDRGFRQAERERSAKAVCARCPVIDECREHALVTPERHGVWGGLSEADRAQAWALGREGR